MALYLDAQTYELQGAHWTSPATGRRAAGVRPHLDADLIQQSIVSPSEAAGLVWSDIAPN